MAEDRRGYTEIFEKMDAMHVDVITIKTNQANMKEDIDDHETILRGKSKTNGLIGDMKAIKTTVNVLRFASAGIVTALGSMWAFVKAMAHLPGK